MCVCGRVGRALAIPFGSASDELSSCCWMMNELRQRTAWLTACAVDSQSERIACWGQRGSGLG